MSVPMRIKCKCSVCGSESDQTVLASSNRFGSPDLDLRPPEMLRSTMRWWLQECPVCGYIARDLSEKKAADADWLLSDQYLKMCRKAPENSLAARFYRYYLINMHDGDVENAFYAALHAAWACDDAGDGGGARNCRMTALFAFQKLEESQAVNENMLLVNADILRRAGMFSELIERYGEQRFSEPLLDQILAFQLERARMKDPACYTVADACGGKDRPIN